MIAFKNMHTRYGTGGRDSRTIFVGGLFMLLIIGGFFFQRYWHNRSREQDSQNGPETLAQPETAFPTITAETVSQKIMNGDKVRLLDLRDRASFEIEHIPNALSLSPGTLASFSAEPDELVVAIYSVRDTQTLEIIKNTLRQKSFKSFLLEGGFEEWKRKNYQTISFGNPNSFNDQSKVILVSPAEALTLLKDTMQRTFLLDVQSEQNYQKKHLRNAKNIPLDQLEKRFREIPPFTIIVVYGESQLVSFQAGVRLHDLNILTAKTLSGDDNLGSQSIFVLQP